MKNILSLFYKNKKENDEEKEEKIKIYLCKNSNQFFLEDGYELRTVESIKLQHKIKDEIFVMETFLKNQSVGKRKLEDFEIPSFLLEKEREKNLDVAFYFYKKKNEKQDKSYVMKKKYSVVKKYLYKEEKNDKVVLEKNVDIKRDDNKNYLNCKLKIFIDKISFQENEKNAVTTQLPFIIIEKIIVNIIDASLIILKTKIINYTIKFKDQYKANTFFQVLIEKFKNWQNKHFKYFLQEETENSNRQKIQNCLKLKNFDLYKIFDDLILVKSLFKLLEEKNKEERIYNIFKNSNIFLQLCKKKMEEKKLMELIVFFLKEKILNLENIIKNNSSSFFEQSIMNELLGSHKNEIRRTGSLIKVSNLDQRKFLEFQPIENPQITFSNRQSFHFVNKENDHFFNKVLESNEEEIEEEMQIEDEEEDNFSQENEKENFLNEKNGNLKTEEFNKIIFENADLEEVKKKHIMSSEELSIDNIDVMGLENYLRMKKVKIDWDFFYFIRNNIQDYLLDFVTKKEFISFLLKNKYLKT